jgi:hypothetical protein
MCDHEDDDGFECDLDDDKEPRLISDLLRLRVFALDAQQSAELDRFLDNGGMGGVEAGIATSDEHGAATGYFRLREIAGKPSELDALLKELVAKAENLLDRHYTEQMHSEGKGYGPPTKPDQ